MALVVADFATYSALRTSLYNQVDQQLAQNRGHLEGRRPVWSSSAAARPRDLARGGGDADTGNSGNSGNTGSGAPAGTGGFPNIFAVSYFAVVTRTRARSYGSVECPAYVNDHPYRPSFRCPSPDSPPSPTGRRSRTSPPAPIAPGGPSFRVRAEKLTGESGAGAGAAPRRPEQHAAHPLPDRTRRDGGRARARPGRRLVAGPARAAPARRRGAHGRLHRGRATSTSGFPAPISRPRWAGWPARSTSCSSGFRRPSRPGWPRSRACARTSSTCASSSPTPRTSCAPRSRPSPPTPSSSSAVGPSTPKTSRASYRASASRRHRMDRLVNDLLTLARLDEGVPMEMAPVELVSLASDAVRTATAVGPGVARAVLGGAPDRGQRRQGPSAPGPRQPAGQRAGPHPAGHDGHGARRPDRRPGADRGP